MSKKAMLKAVALLLIAASLLFVIFSLKLTYADPGGTWWNTSWPYRMPITIKSTSGNLTDYQVKITANLTDEYNAGKLNSTCKDVRFTYYNSTSQAEINIPFWTKDCNVTGDNSTFWTKVPFLQNNVNETVYMYYGNPSASSASNGTATFNFFDDFEDGTYDKWTVVDGTWDASNYYLEYSEFNKYIYATDSASAYDSSGTQWGWDYKYAGHREQTYMRADTGANYNGVYFDTDYSPGIWRLSNYGGAGALEGSYSWTTGETYHIRITQNASSWYELFIDGVSQGSASITGTIPGNYIKLRSYWATVTSGQWDNFFMRKYASPEPTVTFGEEELSAPSVTLNTPADTSYSSNSTITFNCSAEGSGGNLVNISLYTNTTGTWLLNKNNSVTGTSNSTTFTLSDIPDGSYAWNCLAYNDVPLSAFASVNYTFVVDTTNPQINFSESIESNNTNFSRTWIFVNVSVNETNPSMANFTLYNSTTLVNSTSDNLSSFSGAFNRSVNWTGLDEGTYYYNVTVIDKASNSNSTPTYQITLDTTAPTITNMVTGPNTTAELDPGITIYVNATLNDTLSGVKNATLYFRKSGDSYNSTEMDYDSSTGIANASFYVSTADNGTWYYNVTVYDYTGNANSSEDNVSVRYDCTWQLSYTLENASSILESTSIIGNITINNTGDLDYHNNNCTLRFKIDETEMVRDGLEFDGAYPVPTLFFSLYAEGVLGDVSRIVNVTANFASVEKENENFVITIDDRDGRSDITQRTISGYIDSLPGGPYLKLHFVDPDNINSKITSITINQSSSANLTAYVKNIGNETANNVTFNWTLPSGFSSSSGALENNLTSLPNKTAAPDNVHYYNLTITTDHTATYGTNYIYVNASCAENASGCSNRSYSISVKVLCNPDSQCGYGCVYDSAQDNHDPGCYVAPTTTTTTGGGGGGVPFIFKAEATYELIRGRDEIFILPLKNPYSSKTLSNIRVSPSGYLAQYIKIEPPENVSANTTGEIKVRIVAPSYFTTGMHNLTFTIQSVAKEKATADLSRVEKRYVYLAIHELGKGESVNLINEIQTYLEEMKKLNLRTERIQELYDKSLDAINKSDYESVNEIYEQSKELAEAALNSYSIVKDLEENLNGTSEYGIKTPKTDRLVGLAKSALERGDYLLALERVKDAQLTYIIETKGKFGLIYYIRKNTFEFFLYTIATLILLTVLYFRTKISVINYNLKGLQQEEDTLLGLMRVVQKECFEERKMSMSEYNDAMLQYEDKLSKAVQKTIELEAAKANLLKFKHEKLELERKRLLDLMKTTQEKYLKEGAIETQVYNNKMHSFVSRLSALEENLALQEAKQTLRKRKLFWRMFYSIFQAKRKTKKESKQKRLKNKII